MSFIDNCHCTSWSNKNYTSSKIRGNTKNEKTFAAVLVSAAVIFWPTVTFISIFTGPIGIALTLTASISLITVTGFIGYTLFEDD